MNRIFTPNKNYHQTKKQIGYVPRKQATKENYRRISQDLKFINSLQQKKITVFSYQRETLLLSLSTIRKMAL